MTLAQHWHRLVGLWVRQRRYTKRGRTVQIEKKAKGDQVIKFGNAKKDIRIFRYDPDNTLNPFCQEHDCYEISDFGISIFNHEDNISSERIPFCQKHFDQLKKKLQVLQV
jgi:hypothetical protein